LPLWRATCSTGTELARGSDVPVSQKDLSLFIFTLACRTQDIVLGDEFEITKGIDGLIQEKADSRPSYCGSSQRTPSLTVTLF
jgi:hypothetical protein